MGLGDILKQVVLPVAAGAFLGPTASTGLKALGLTKAATNPLISNAFASGLGSLVMGGKPKDALRSALVGGLGGTALQQKFPRTNVPTAAGAGSDVMTDAFSEGMKKGVSGKSAVKAFEPKTLSGELLQSFGVGDNFLTKILNNPLGEGLAAGLAAQLLATLTDEEEDERSGFERRPFGAGGPGGQIGGLRGFAMGGPAMPQQISKPGFPRRDGAIMPYEGGGRVDDVPAMLTAGEFVLTKDAVKGLGGGNQSLGIQRAYDMMGDLEGMA